jgi:serine/threonine protein kinase
MSGFKVPILSLRPSIVASNTNNSSRSSGSHEDEECREFTETAQRRLERERLEGCMFDRTRHRRELGRGQYGVVFQVDDDRVVKHSSLIHRTMYTRCTPDVLATLRQRLRDGWNEPAAERDFSRIVGAAFSMHVYHVYGARHCKESPGNTPVAEIEIDRLRGQTLLSAFRGLKDTELSDVFIQLLYVTAYASYQGVIHNDLHFGNVMLVPHGGADLELAGVGGTLMPRTLKGVTYRAVLIDYGLARFAPPGVAYKPTDTVFVVGQFFPGRIPVNMAEAITKMLDLVPFVPLNDHILVKGYTVPRGDWGAYGVAINSIVDAVVAAGGHVDYEGPRTPFTDPYSSGNNSVNNSGNNNRHRGGNKHGSRRRHRRKRRTVRRRRV